MPAELLEWQMVLGRVAGGVALGARVGDGSNGGWRPMRRSWRSASVPAQCEIVRRLGANGGVGLGLTAANSVGPPECEAIEA